MPEKGDIRPGNPLEFDETAAIAGPIALSGMVFGSYFAYKAWHFFLHATGLFFSGACEEELTAVFVVYSRHMLWALGSLYLPAGLLFMAGADRFGPFVFRSAAWLSVFWFTGSLFAIGPVSAHGSRSAIVLAGLYIFFWGVLRKRSAAAATCGPDPLAASIKRLASIIFFFSVVYGGFHLYIANDSKDITKEFGAASYAEPAPEAVSGWARRRFHDIEISLPASYSIKSAFHYDLSPFGSRRFRTWSFALSSPDRREELIVTSPSRLEYYSPDPAGGIFDGFFASGREFGEYMAASRFGLLTLVMKDSAGLAGADRFTAPGAEGFVRTTTLAKRPSPNRYYSGMSWCAHSRSIVFNAFNDGSTLSADLDFASRTGGSATAEAAIATLAFATPASADAGIAEGIALHKTGEYGEAKFAFCRALASDAKSSTALYYLADCFASEGENQPAYNCLINAEYMAPTPSFEGSAGLIAGIKEKLRAYCRTFQPGWYKDKKDETPVTSTAQKEKYASARVETPAFSPKPNEKYPSGQKVAINCPTVGAQIKYSLGNPSSTSSEWHEYTSEVALTASSYISAVARKSGLETSKPAIGFYSIYKGTLKPGYSDVSVEGGEFARGCDEARARDDEKPARKITVGDFYIGAKEVTNSRFCYFLNIMRADENGYMGGIRVACLPHTDITMAGSRFVPAAGLEDHPVICATWRGAAAYCNFVSRQNGNELCYDEKTWIRDLSKKGYRLPTEAEWEFAARGGRKSRGYAYSGGNELPRIAWFRDNSVPGRTGTTGGFRTGSKPPNELGLHDMSGNAWEWCDDWYDPAYYASSPNRDPAGPANGTRKILRGGSFLSVEYGCRVTFRYSGEVGDRPDAAGFRTVLSEGQGR